MRSRFCGSCATSFLSIRRPCDLDLNPRIRSTLESWFSDRDGRVSSPDMCVTAFCGVGVLVKHRRLKLSRALDLHASALRQRLQD